MKTFAEVLAHLDQLNPHHIHPSLTRITRVLAALDDPQNHIPIIHIAGTNGKGSVASLLHHLLKEQGFTTVLYTSPHLETPRERFRLGQHHQDEMVSEEEFVNLWQQVQDACDKSETLLTYFETMTAMAFVWAKHKQVDWLVAECGMGGRWDATNTGHARCAVLTNVDYDHEQWLGPTLEKIFLEKQAIVKADQVVVSAVSQPSLQQQLIATCAEQRARLYLYGRDVQAWVSDAGAKMLSVRTPGAIWNEIPLSAQYQKCNIAVALMAFECVCPVYQRGLVEAALKSWTWPGRMEWLNAHVCVDGAHNMAGVQALVEELKHWPTKPTLMWGVMADKKWVDMLALLAPWVNDVVLVEGFSLRQCAASVLEKECLKYGLKVSKIDSQSLSHWFTVQNHKSIVAGSLYLVGLVKAVLKMTKRI